MEEKNNHEKNDEIYNHIKKLLSPEPIDTLKDLDEMIKPLHRYVGPGLWLRILK